MDLSTLALVSAIALFCYWKYVTKREKFLKPLPPGPRGVSTILNFMNAAKNFTLHLYAEGWARKYGDIMSISLFNQNIIFLNNARIMRKCFCDNSLKMVTNDRPKTFASAFVFKNQNIGLSPLGPLHTRLRKVFHGSLKMYGDGIHIFEQTMMEELRHVVMEINSRSTVHLDDIVSKSLLNVIHILLTDERANYNSHAIREMMKYNSAVNSLFGLEVDQPLTMLPFLRFLPGPFRTKCQEVKSRIQKLFDIFFETRQTRPPSPGAHHGLIDAALETQININDKSKLADEHIRFLALEIISAGYLTTKGTVLGIVLALMERPQLQDKVHGIIKAAIGDRMVTVADRSELAYVDAMIIEGIRYLSHGPVTLPHCTKQDVEVEGYRVPKNSLILTNLWFMGHDDKIWDKPWEFRPERFLDDDGLLLPTDHPVRQQFHPFGVGRRQCPGEMFAKTRLFLYLTTLFQHFKFLPPEGGMTASSDTRTWTPGILLQPSEVLCKVELRTTHPLLTEETVIM